MPIPVPEWTRSEGLLRLGTMRADRLRSPADPGAAPETLARRGLRWALAALYTPFGVLHVTRPGAFLPIMPPAIPHPQAVVVATGVAEILGGIGLLLPQTRKAAGVGLALYAIGVYPANIYHAVAGVHVPPLPDSWWYHGPRLAFQPVFVLWALYAGGLIGRSRR